jgi:hypothetical protein
MKVWLVIEWGDVDESDKVVGVYATEEGAQAKRESMMVRVPGLDPWDLAGVEEFEVQP